ncbi:MAG: dUTP diphosphatase [Candidatus Heimdallarchaeota archaeon]
MKSLRIKILKIDTRAVLPKKAHISDAASDIYAIEDAMVPPGSTAILRTGFCLEIPTGVYGRIETRSSMAVKGLFTTGGIIDSGYRDEIFVILNNGSQEICHIHQGQRIAQIIFHEANNCDFVEVTRMDTRDDRKGGLGSTGE